MRSDKRLTLVGALCLAATPLSLALAPAGSTYAQFSDFDIERSSAGAGIWKPDPPADCGDLSNYGTPPSRADRVIWGTPDDDILQAGNGNHPHIIMGLGGDDVIYGGNSKDCLVGGDGNDRLYGGNAKDILLGGAGDDYLNGERAKDKIDGQGDNDDCDGGLGKNEIVNCGPETLVFQTDVPTDQPTGESEDKKTGDTKEPPDPGQVPPQPADPPKQQDPSPAPDGPPAPTDDQSTPAPPEDDQPAPEPPTDPEPTESPAPSAEPQPSGDGDSAEKDPPALPAASPAPTEAQP